MIKTENLPSKGPIGTPGQRKSKSTKDGEGAETEDYLPLIMIAVSFEEQPYSTTYDWYDIIFDQKYSLKQYYKDMSFDKFTFMPVQESSIFEENGNTNMADKENDGIIHVSLPRKKECGWNIYDRYDSKETYEIFTCLSDALTEAAKSMDFSVYDTNDDGKIQTDELAIGFIIAGNDAADYQSIGNVPKAEEYRFVWPIADTFSRMKRVYTGSVDMPVVDNVEIDDFIMIAENKISSGEKKATDIGVLSHELGHYLGLPDMYSTLSFGTWSAFRIDYLSVMDAGCYGSDMDGNTRPYSLDIWSRVRLGWTETKTISNDDGMDYRSSIAGSMMKTDDPHQRSFKSPLRQSREL